MIRTARKIAPLRAAYRRLSWLSSALLNPELARVLSVVRPYTMLSPGQLRNAHDAVRSVEERKIPGAIVECGCWRGGCGALMAWTAGRSRTTWLFDSFQGLPAPKEIDGPDAVALEGRLVASIDDVRQVLELLHATAEIRPGWFSDTLPVARPQIGPIAVLRLDGDWYESTKVCLEQLFELVSPGGIVILDDYDYWQGCRAAADEFLASRGITVHMTPIALNGGRQFVKS
jgi:O-methyltransferase